MLPSGQFPPTLLLQRVIKYPPITVALINLFMEK